MAGSSMKSIKLRIKSVQSTMQITHAMQLVATSKLRRSKERMEQSKSYAGIAGEAVKAVLSACKDEHIAFAQKREVKKRCYVIIAGERGLAGGYNNNIFKAVQAMDDGTPYCVLPIGRKAIEKYQHLGVELLNTEHAHVEGLPVGACFTLARMLAEGYEKGDFDELILVHTSFINMMSQEVVSDRLLPVEQPESKDPRLVSTVFDPNPEETLKSIIPPYIAGRLYAAACDAFASEISARRNAMDSATKNAGEMISGLQLKYNRARQGAITQEITEIVAGSEGS